LVGSRAVHWDDMGLLIVPRQVEKRSLHYRIIKDCAKRLSKKHTKLKIVKVEGATFVE